MKPVTRQELLDLGGYEQVREHFRRRVIAEKQARYVALGGNMTALFENRDTVLFQIQEMLRTERITAEKAILHELETYNELVPGDHELSASIFIEYPDRDERERMLVALAGVDDKFYLLAGGDRCTVVPDPRSTEAGRTIAVHFVKFPLSPAAEKAVREGRSALKLGVAHPAYSAEVELSAGTLQSLAADFE